MPCGLGWQGTLQFWLLGTAPTYRFWVVALPLACCVTSVRKENKPALHLAQSRQRINSSCYSLFPDGLNRLKKKKKKGKVWSMEPGSIFNYVWFLGYVTRRLDLPLPRPQLPNL